MLALGRALLEEAGRVKAAPAGSAGPDFEDRLLREAVAVLAAAADAVESAVHTIASFPTGDCDGNEGSSGGITNSGSSNEEGAFDCSGSSRRSIYHHWHAVAAERLERVRDPLEVLANQKMAFDMVPLQSDAARLEAKGIIDGIKFSFCEPQEESDENGAGDFSM
jgi:hypothetical protein